MRPVEEGFLLLTSQLGDPLRRPLSPASMRQLKQRLKTHPPEEPGRDMTAQDLIRMGCAPEFAEHVMRLLSQQAQLTAYLSSAEKQGIQVLTWATAGYPKALLRGLNGESPGTLWAKGDLSLLAGNCVSLVGSRDIRPANRAFAEAVGRWAARKGHVLVSGNARGADKVGQESCLAAGGKVICVLADALTAHHAWQRMLLLSENGYELPFSAQRAISRNRVIHALGTCTFVAQAAFQRGGTWNGTMQNLKRGYSRVLCFDDGSAAAAELIRQGAEPVALSDLDPDK